MLVGSNEMPFTAWKHTERNRQRDRKKYVMITMIPEVQNNSLNDSTLHSLEPTYSLDSIKNTVLGPNRQY